MTSQPRFSTITPNTRIDQVLNALRTTEPPAGMEERIAQRLAARLQQTEARTLSANFKSSSAPERRSFFAVILTLSGVKGKDPRILPMQARIYATAATALAILITLSVTHFRTTMQPSVATTQVAQGFSLAPHRVHQEAAVSTPAVSQRSEAITLAETNEGIATTQVPRGFSLGSHSSDKSAGVLIPAPQPDPDAIALAETNAPTRAAAPLPLTLQEQAIVAATRPGQPIQLAELDTAREPLVHAAARARTNAAIERFVHSSLAPLAVADMLQPTSDTQPQEVSDPAPAPQPPTSSSN